MKDMYSRLSLFITKLLSKPLLRPSFHLVLQYKFTQIVPQFICTNVYRTFIIIQECQNYWGRIVLYGSITGPSKECVPYNVFGNVIYYQKLKKMQLEKLSSFRPSLLISSMELCSPIISVSIFILNDTCHND